MDKENIQGLSDELRIVCMRYDILVDISFNPSIMDWKGECRKGDKQIGSCIHRRLIDTIAELYYHIQLYYGMVKE